MSTPGFRILPAAKRPEESLLAQFREFASAHISDVMNRMHSATGLRQMHRQGRMCGVAFTVHVPPGDNLMMHRALDIAAPGDVLVVNAGGELTNAIAGEIMTTYAKERKLGGFVIDGAIRDSGSIGAEDFPVFARGVTHRGPFKNGPGEINVPISIGGMVVMPGDIIVGDEDGVVTVSPQDASFVAEKVRALAEKERKGIAAIKAKTNDRSWVAEALREKGLKV
ncbi:MAG: RraA family protein [Proteobacteria bacterium]|nr:RraA family protein [Pseudomonadota bacterium]